EVVLDHHHETPRRVKNPDTMRKPGVGRSRVHQVREAELLHPPKPLERTGFEHAPERILELVGPELDQVVQWIADALTLEHDGSYFVLTHDARRFVPGRFSAARPRRCHAR